MVTPLNQTTQAAGKCPHGLPVGACPICSGMGGSMKKDRDKPRVPGEMSYNECMAEWMKILAAKDAKIQAQKDRLEANQLKALENKEFLNLDKIQKNFDKFLQNLENLPAIIKTPVQFILKTFIAPIINLIAKIPNVIKNIQNLSQNILNLISSTTEKLATILGEIKNFIQAFTVNKIKKAIKTILSLMTEDENDEEENEEIQKLKARELKKVLKGIFRIKRHPKEEKDEESIV